MVEAEEEIKREIDAESVRLLQLIHNAIQDIVVVRNCAFDRAR